MKLLEPLARALDVSLVELMRGERLEADALPVEEAEQVVSQAMDRSQKATARRMAVGWAHSSTNTRTPHWCRRRMVPVARSPPPRTTTTPLMGG